MLARALSLVESIEVVGEVDSFSRIDQAIEDYRPHWLLLASREMDDTPTLLRRLLRKHPALGVMVLSNSWQQWKVRYPGGRREGAASLHSVEASMAPLTQLVSILQLQEGPRSLRQQ
jgi:hypothetical protein